MPDSRPASRPPSAPGWLLGIGAVVLALMAAAGVYAVTIGIVNCPRIGV